MTICGNDCVLIWIKARETHITETLKIKSSSWKRGILGGAISYIRSLSTSILAIIYLFISILRFSWQGLYGLHGTSNSQEMNKTNVLFSNDLNGIDRTIF